VGIYIPKLRKIFSLGSTDVDEIWHGEIDFRSKLYPCWRNVLLLRGENPKNRPMSIRHADVRGAHNAGNNLQDLTRYRKVLII